MKEIKENFQKEIILLKNLIEQAEKRYALAPKGQLRIQGANGKIQYYYKESNSNNKYEYIKKNEHKLAKEIAQRDYDEKLIKLANERIKLLESFCVKEERTSLKKLYENLNEYRKELIEAPILSDEEYTRRWQALEYKRKPFGELSTEIYSERGERVRSKSEKIIADKLYYLNIPYRYEYPIILNNVKIHPDFTILKLPERKEVYLEHLGMMDDANYIEKAIDRIRNYEINGLYLGKELYITYETSKNLLNTKVLDKFLKRIFI